MLPSLTCSSACASSARMRRASPSSCSPSAVATTCRPERSSSGQPICCSSLRICWLMVDWVRWTRSPARVKLPVSIIATKLRSNRGSSMGFSIYKTTETHFII